ncbi:unnamed protein product [Cyclocybe aegerita]|uniref:Chitinase n=1 Tax=Cyclocybe aegerita TaxID=1973307 RepID=A0A8S0VR48_CYCAE|nr:unnamed protein product [Cyclocybe aegerita]
MAATVSITKHTTASKPYPHILYVVEINVKGKQTVIERRFSEFLILHEALRDEFILPPKRYLSTTLLPSAWVDDDLIAERKLGLARYLSSLLWSAEYRKHPLFLAFLKRGSTSDMRRGISVEDVLPSTLLKYRNGDTAKQVGLDSVFVSKQVMSGWKNILAAYYPEWSTASMPPEKLDYKRFDILFFGFVTPNSTSSLDWGANTQATLKRLVRSAVGSGAGTKIVLSVGGWEGSQWFSHACSTAITRMALVDAIVTAVNEYGLHGIDIDWEFPNFKGVGNPYSPQDAKNLLLLFQALRAALGPAMIISAAVGHSPWLDEDGLPMRDMSAFADELSFINIMNYSVYETSAPGPNAPLGNIILKPNKPQTTAGGAFTQWKVAGFPPSQMLLGLPLFGYVFKSNKTGFTPSALQASTDGEEAPNVNYSRSVFRGAHIEVGPKTPSKDSDARAKAKKTVEGGAFPEVSMADWWGTRIAFKDIVQTGALKKMFDGNYTQGDGYTLGWDEGSSTPFLFDVNQHTLVTFDNTRSLAAKVQFAKQNGMAGCFTWSLDQDDEYALQDVVRSVLLE